MLVMGLDPSLTSTGIVVLRDGKVESATTTKNKPKLGTIGRVKDIRFQISNIAGTLTDKDGAWQIPDLYVIEGFSYGSKGRSVFDIAYLGWRIREQLEEWRIKDGTPWIEVPPTQVKKFATGQGTSGKEIMLQQVYKRWGVEFRDNNQCDAFVLAKIGEAYLSGTEGLTSFQAEVIASLKGEPAKKRKKVEKDG